MGLVLAAVSRFPAVAAEDSVPLWYQMPPAWNVRFLGQIGGSCFSVAVVDRYAYFNEGANLSILDVSHPASPTLVTCFPLGEFVVGDLQVANGLAYMVGGDWLGRSGIQIVDVSNPVAPRHVAFCSVPYAGRVYVADGHAYIVGGYAFASGSRSYLSIVDVSNPSSLTLQTTFVEEGYCPNNIYVTGGVAYMAAIDGLRIFDVTDAAHPTPIGYFYLYYCWDVVVAGNLAYAATDNGLKIIDVTNPSSPTLFASCSTWLEPEGVCLSGSLVYLAERGGIIEIVDVTNPSSPTARGNCRTKGTATDVSVSSGTACVACVTGGLSIVDVTNATSPTLLTNHNTLSDARGVYVQNGVAYVASGAAGVKTVDVSNPVSPRLIGSLPLRGVWYGGVTICGNSAYASGALRRTGGGETPCSFDIVDVTTPSLPQWLGAYDTSEPVRIPAVTANLAYLGLKEYGLEIVDITNPASPTLRGSFDTPGLAREVSLSGPLAFVNDSSLQVIDVANPAAPYLRASYWRAFSVMSDVFDSRRRRYLCGAISPFYPPSEFYCLDVTNPDDIQITGIYTLGGNLDISNISVSNGRAYMVQQGLYVFDVTKSSSPTLCGYYPSGLYIGNPVNIFVSGDLIYYTDAWGLRIFEYTGPSTSARRWEMYR